MSRLRLSIPAIAFAAAVCWIGWTAGHELTYDVLGLTGSMPADSVHGYMPFTRGGAALLAVGAFGLFLRALFSAGSARSWLRGAGTLGTRAQLLIATIVPSATFFVAESVERAYAPVEYVSALELLVVGLPVQVCVGILTLLISRFSLHAAAQVVDFLHESPLVRRPESLVEAIICQWDSPATRPLVEAAAGRAPPRCLTF